MGTLAVGTVLSIDHYAELTMTYTADGFAELKEDITRNGQRIPIILRCGKVLDGRHRYRACMDLGLGIQYEEVGDISDADAIDIVLSNSIHKTTGTDASKVEAYLICKAKGTKKTDMPELFKRLNKNYIKKISYIEKENPEYLHALLRQNSVRLHSIEFDKLEDYGTIHGIWRTLKSNNKFDNKVVEVENEPTKDFGYEVYIDEVLPNETAVQEFWDVYGMAKSCGNEFKPSSPLGKIIIDYIIGRHE